MVAAGGYHAVALIGSPSTAIEEQPDDEDPANDLPRTLGIGSVAPNPFNPTIRIRLDVPTPCHVAVDICDLRGRHVAALMHGEVAAGRHDLRWDGQDDRGRPLPSGIYLVRMRDEGGNLRARKITLAR